MKRSILARTAIVLLVITAFIACQEEKKPINFPSTDLAKSDMIPMPLKTISTNSAFALDKNTAIYTSASDQAFIDVGAFLSE